MRHAGLVVKTRLFAFKRSKPFANYKIQASAISSGVLTRNLVAL